MTSQLRRKRRTTVRNTRLARVISLRDLAVALAAVTTLAAAILTTAACCRPVSAADPLPLFLAARQTDDDLSPQMRRAAQLRVDQRAAAVANANLKWKPYRPQVASTPVTAATAEKPSPASATAPGEEIMVVTSIETVPTVEPNALSAEPIATSDGGELRFRRVIPRAAHGKLRGDILRVSSDDSDPFADMNDSLSTEPPAEEAKPPKKTPARKPPAESGEPKPLTEDPFSGDDFNNTIPPPDSAYPNQNPNELPFASPNLSPTVSCDQDKRECEAALIKLRHTTLDKLDIDIAVTGSEGGDFPCECPLTGEFDGRRWACTTFTWKASLAVHKPLYFEEVGLERYGHSLNPLIGPLWSGVHFFITIPVLPYKMSLDPINECQYVLGYYRPGNCAPYLFPPVPLSVEAAMIEAASVVGGVFILR